MGTLPRADAVDRGRKLPPRRDLAVLRRRGRDARRLRPLVVAALGIRRWARHPRRSGAPPPDPALLERVRREAMDEGLAAAVAGDPGSPLVAERARLYAALRELDFDYRAAKLSAGDHTMMRQEYEARAVGVLAALESTAPEATRATPAARPEFQSARAGHRDMSLARRGWRLAVAAMLLLAFGVVIGVPHEGPPAPDRRAGFHHRGLPDRDRPPGDQPGQPNSRAASS